MFSLYSEQQGSTALWTELQNVQLDANGQYTVLLGSQHAEGEAGHQRGLFGGAVWRQRDR